VAEVSLVSGPSYQMDLQLLIQADTRRTRRVNGSRRTAGSGRYSWSRSVNLGPHLMRSCCTPQAKTRCRQNVTNNPRNMPGVDLTSAFVQVFGCRHDEAILALRRPASEKRQGTKSREVGHRRCRGRCL